MQTILCIVLIAYIGVFGVKLGALSVRIFQLIIRKLTLDNAYNEKILGSMDTDIPVSEFNE